MRCNNKHWSVHWIRSCAGSLGGWLIQTCEWDTRLSWTDGWKRKVGGGITEEFKCKVELLLYFPQEQEPKHRSWPLTCPSFTHGSKCDGSWLKSPLKKSLSFMPPCLSFCIAFSLCCCLLFIVCVCVNAKGVWLRLCVRVWERRGGLGGWKH